MYQFVGQQAINDSLHSKGYSSARITRQFLGLTAENNRYTNSIRFMDDMVKSCIPSHRLIIRIPFILAGPLKSGRVHYDSRDSLINEPIDFTGSKQSPVGIPTTNPAIRFVSLIGAGETTI